MTNERNSRKSQLALVAIERQPSFGQPGKDCPEVFLVEDGGSTGDEDIVKVDETKIQTTQNSIH